MEKSSSALDRSSSLEREPRTINIDIAREQAIYVVNTRSVEEAFTIFTEGLLPVTRCGRFEASDMTDMDEELECVQNTSTRGMIDSRKTGSAPF